MIVEVGGQLRAMRRDAVGVPQHVAVSAFVDQAEDLAAELGQHVGNEMLVLKPQTAQASIGPLGVKATGQ